MYFCVIFLLSTYSCPGFKQGIKGPQENGHIIRVSHAISEAYNVGMANIEPCVPWCVKSFSLFSLFNHSTYLHSVAFGDFFWNELADETKVQLAEHGIIDCKSNVQARRSMLNSVVVPGLFYLQSSKEHGTSVAEVARMAYRSLPKDISRYAPILILFKDVGENGAKIAHPTIFQTCLDEFINSLGGSEPNLSPLEVRLFGHLRTTSFSTSNIQRARTG